MDKPCLTQDQIEQIITNLLDTRLADLRDEWEIYTDDRVDALSAKVEAAFKRAYDEF